MRSKNYSGQLDGHRSDSIFGAILGGIYFVLIFTVFFAVLVLLTGCSSVDRITTAGAKASDQAISAAEFTICHGASVGSIRRSYGSPERSRIWADLCNSADSFEPDK